MTHVMFERGRRAMAGAAMAAVLVAGCAGAGTPATSPPASVAPASPVGETVEVTLATDPALGPILVGEGGMTLYLFTKDTGGTSACSGDCASAWPPFVIAEGASVVGGTGVPGVLATITRDDGALQVTYDGKPLYYYATDTKAGDVLGNKVGDVWFVVPPTGSTSSGGASATPGDDDYSRGGGGASPAAGGAPKAAIADFSFTPGTLTVAAGSTVTWTNDGDQKHTVTADDGSFESEQLDTGDTFSQAFPTAGTFAYHCLIHPQMVGSVVVTP